MLCYSINKMKSGSFYFRSEVSWGSSILPTCQSFEVALVFAIEMFLMSEAFFAELIFTIVTHNVSRMFCECSNEICVLNASRFG